MKINISKPLDTVLLHNSIMKYESANDSQCPYLFMNEQTANAMNYPIKVDYIDKVSSDYIIGNYCGYKIYINSDLNFGEVELR